REGKSASLTHIMGLPRADSGEGIVRGEDVTNFTEQDVYQIGKKATTVSQPPALVGHLTPRDNMPSLLWDELGLTQEDIDAYTDKLAKELEVEEVLDKVPSELSTGMKRAVAIARALAQNPEAILYDEPTTMVDPIMAGHMGDLIQRLKDKF